jgi:hypothetical protein
MYRIVIVAVLNAFEVLCESGHSVTQVTFGSPVQIFTFKLVARGSAAALNNAVV